MCVPDRSPRGNQRGMFTPGFPQRCAHISQPSDAGWVGGRAYQHEIVVHDGITLQALAVSNKFEFLFLGVGKTTSARGQRTPSQIEQM